MKKAGSLEQFDVKGNVEGTYGAIILQTMGLKPAIFWLQTQPSNPLNTHRHLKPVLTEFQHKDKMAITQ